MTMKKIKKLQPLKEAQLPKAMQKIIMGGNTWGYEPGGFSHACEDEGQMGDGDFTSTITDEGGNTHRVDICL